MDYKRFGNTVVVRIDIGEEINESINKIAKSLDIKLATVSALGAVNNFTIGVFKPDEKKYYGNHFEGDYEIVSLTGSITTMDGEVYSHIHMSAGDDQGHVVGGHLNEAYVSVTCEMFIHIIDGAVDRQLDESININLLKFD